MRKERPSLPTVVCLMVLDLHAEVPELDCTTGRGSEKYAPVWFFPSETRRTTLHEECKNQWFDLIPEEKYHNNFKRCDPEEPHNLKYFAKFGIINFQPLKY